MGKPLSTLRDRVESYSERVRRRYPMAAAVGNLSIQNLERLGERTTGSRMGKIALLAFVALVLFAAPVAAQSCTKGILGFLGALKTMSVQALGLMLFALLAAGVILRAIPVQGTSTAGNVILGGVIAGVVILVIGTAVIDIAGQFTDIKLAAKCSTGGGN